MKAHLSIVLLIVGISASGIAKASKFDEINVRTHIGNSSMNKVVGARLQGMLAGSSGRSSGSTPGKKDCVTQIGNQNANQSLIGSQQDVIVIGDIINFCQ